MARHTHRTLTSWLIAACLLLWAGAGHALQVTHLSPQGAVNEVRQVLLRTDQDAVRLGDPLAPAPASIQCSAEGAQTGTGRWNHAREWVWQFDQPVPAGVRCTVALNADFRSPTHSTLTRAKNQPARYQFEVAGPHVLRSWPPSYEDIDEEQRFVLRLNGPATRESLLEHSYCRAQDVGERIALRWVDVDDAQAQAILHSLGVAQQARQQPTHWAVLACNRRLTAGSEVQLVYGAGVQTPSGVSNREAQTLSFTVRQPFTAELHCERERAHAGCMPLRPLRLDFSAPVDKALAAQVHLVGAGQTLSPVLNDESNLVDSLHFAAPLPAATTYSLELPSPFVDDAGRPLANAASFPLRVQTGDEPALAKFAAAPFGVLERFAEHADGTAILPLTVRHLEGLHQADGAAQLRALHLSQDADIIAWWSRLQHYRWDSAGSRVSRQQAQRDSAVPLPAPLPATQNEDGDEDDTLLEVDADYVSPRSISLLQGRSGVQPITLPAPQAGEPRPFEVVGIPLKQPGFYVLELDSPRLGTALLDARMGPQRRMFVRTSVLVTNLAVHAKLGQEGSAIWVTSLDHGQPVAGAQVQVSDCAGQVHARGQTDSQGLLHLPQLARTAPSCQNDPSDQNDQDGSAYSYHPQEQEWFISARLGDDLAFVWSDWQRGIEPWRFNLPVGWGDTPRLIAHSVLDRSLLRAGDTLSMKHFVRQESASGLLLPPRWPGEVLITHTGSGQEYRQPLTWQPAPGDSRNALSTFAVPPAAKLGQYQVALVDAQSGDSWPSGSFRVEAFRLPTLEGRVQPVAPDGHSGPLVQPPTLPVAVQLHYLNGGSANGQAVQVSALLRERALHFPRWAGFQFDAPRHAEGQPPAPQSEGEDEEAATAAQGRLLADKLPLTLDAHGQGQLTLPAPGTLTRPQELVLEASFADPNGEIQTLRSNHTLWPAAVLAGLQVDSWVSVQRRLQFQAVAVDTQGQPQAGVPVSVQAVRVHTTSTRKRLVGGFYSYDNHTTYTPLGQVCRGKSDASGLLACTIDLTEPGAVELIATATDAQGHRAQSGKTVWVTGQGELWFGGDDHDRMDLLPEKPAYTAGETARLQVRMPFRSATALVSVEREGVLHTQVVQLRGDNPTLTLPVQAGWGPNVYVSVLALRGRLHDVPWYSFFTWGFKNPSAWWSAYRSGQDYSAPTALVDLSKPAFRLGVAELQVRDPEQQLHVEVTTDQPRYQVRDTAQVHIQVRQANGQPAAHAQVAVAAVDKALLELLPNTSWQLADGLWRRRAWSVTTATAQTEVVGRRHYGLKAAAPGGGGGHAPTRELLDTLLLWQPVVQLDAQGRAQLALPLNDALTSFDIVAIADAGVQRFGTGSTSISTTQDLQLISGLPPVVREGDHFTAQFTLRNTTAQAMRVQLQPQVSPLSLNLEPQTLDIPPGQSVSAQWPVTIPLALTQAEQGQLHWELHAQDTHSPARDALRLEQRLLPATPLAVQQATLVQIDSHWSQDLQWPAQAVPGKGGLRLSFSPRLADPEHGVPGLRAWWQSYPHTCLEQTTSRAVGLGDAGLWDSLMAQLPTYLDADGLALYFPPQGQQQPQGSDTLTAHLLTLSHLMARQDARFTLPAAEQARMQQALIAFVTGKLERPHWSPRPDLPERKLAAIAALALDGKATPAMLDSLDLHPSTWPTHSLLDWLSVLHHLALPDRAQRQQEAWQLLRNRLGYQGTQIVFSSEAQDHWWWLMQSPNVNAARLLLATLGQPDWDADRPRLVSGLLARQRNGHWGTTTANLWAGLALRQFSQQYEREAVTGHTTALLHASTQTLDWNTWQHAQPPTPSATGLLPGGSHALDAELPTGTLFLPWGDSTQGQLRIQHRGTGRPWMALQALAAVPRTQAINAGYRVRKTITPLPPAQGEPWQRGDLLRVRLEVEASADMTWVALHDPIPAGASILGSGLGRDSALATHTERSPTGHSSPAFIERDQDSYRAYWSYLPQGSSTVEYTLRLNNAGSFALPPTRIEALYAPEMFGELPNPRWEVRAVD